MVRLGTYTGFVVLIRHSQTFDVTMHRANTKPYVRRRGHWIETPISNFIFNPFGFTTKSKVEIHFP